MEAPYSFRQDLDELIRHTRPVWEGLNGASVFITGGTGFIGTWLVASAIHAVETLKIDLQIGILSRRSEAGIACLPYFFHHPSVTWVQGDVRDFPFPPGDWTHLIHAGSESRTVEHAKDPFKVFWDNIAGAERVVQFANLRGVKRALLLSSGAVYGPLTESQSPVSENFMGAPSTTAPASGYSNGKRAAESVFALLGEQFKIATCTARCFTFVGPFQPMRSSFAVGNFIADAVEGKPIRIEGDGAPLRSFLYVSDLVEFLMTILTKAPAREVYNVGASLPISILELAETVNRVVPGNGVQVSGNRDGNPRPAYVPDMNKLHRELGLGPRVHLEEAVRRTAEWYRQSLDQPPVSPS